MRLMAKNKVTIPIIGDINEDMYSYVLNEFREALKLKAAICIILNSAGGCATDGLAIASLIRKHPYPVSVHGTGLIASAATIILAAGHKGLRSMDSTAWLMVHEDSDKMKGKTTDFENAAKTMRRMEDQWCSLFEIYSNTTKELWREINKVEQYFSADEALDFGVIDLVVGDIFGGK